MKRKKNIGKLVTGNVAVSKHLLIRGIGRRPIRKGLLVPYILAGLTISTLLYVNNHRGFKMKRLRHTHIFLVLLMTLFSFQLGCSGKDEKIFKNTAKQLRKILLELKNVKAELNKRPLTLENQKEGFVIDMSKKNEFILQRKSEWNRIAYQFRDFIAKNPNTSWTDDAGFCLVMLYLSISQPGNDYYIEAIKEIKLFLSEFSNVHIEDWTKGIFEEVPSFELVFNRNLSKPIEPLFDLPEDKRVKGMFSRAVIYELLKSGNISKAKKEFEMLEQKTEDKEILLGLKDDIIRFEEFTKISEKGDRKRDVLK